ncbi:MAG: non-ribosomal peptide synthetase, partial [Verrucomicrobia bacterium]|nr:non-ribosomal peptide synthetase [Verrucomicrobiota bacterium]
PATLRAIVVGSERVDRQRLRTWRQLAGNWPMLFHAYGVSEATITSLLHQVESEEALFGRPIANVQTRVMDLDGQELPIGAAGELWLSGAGLARGYLHSPELTAKRFVSRDGARYYRTGDRVRRQPNGTFQFFGRIDHQIKLHGLRIEPAEVESELLKYPGVQAAVVRLQDERLIAYVTGTVNADSLMDYLRTRLPSGLIPARIQILQRMPRTRSGKIDLNALPALADPVRQSRLPISCVELQIADIWQEVLRIKEVGVHDNFFDLGGRSLLLMRVQARLATELGREIPMLELFRRPTIHDLAQYFVPKAHEHPFVR